MDSTLPIIYSSKYDLENIDGKFVITYILVKNGLFKNYLTGQDLTCKIINNTSCVELTVLNGELHSFNDKPALFWEKSNIKGWFKNGKPHRETGPASIFNNCQKEWWLWGIKMDEKAIELYNLDPEYESYLRKKYGFVIKQT